MVSKILGVQMAGRNKFIKTIMLWQEEWFYMADVTSKGQKGVPAFLAMPLEQLHSWSSKNFSLGE